MRPIAETEIPTAKEILALLGFGEHRSGALSSSIHAWKKASVKNSRALYGLTEGDFARLELEQLAVNFLNHDNNHHILWPTGGIINYVNNRDQ